MDENIRKELEQEDISPFHKALLAHCKGLVRMSRWKMQDFYPRWDEMDRVFNGERVADVQDKKAKDQV